MSTQVGSGEWGVGSEHRQGSRRRSPCAGVVSFALVVAFSQLPTPDSHLHAQTARGKATYDKWCAECHGDTGAGDGSAAAFMLPRPRDFTKGIYQIRTTASGELPTDQDLRRILDDGMPGTAMPGWKTKLTEAERNDVLAYIKTFSKFFQGAAPKGVALGSAPGGGAEAVAEGRATYQKLECFKCHGQEGRGDGTSAPTLTDDWDQPIRAADLHASWTFNGGNTVEQIYTRLRTGLDGTPMPSFTDAIENKLVTEQQLWRVAQYVRSLSPEEPIAVREVVRAVLVEGQLPASPADSAWNRSEGAYIPLVGQIILKPRWFSPTVHGVWVQALHDGQRLALKFRWHDPSQSPAPAWGEWLGRVRTAMTDVDGPIDSTQGPDRFTVQFPVNVTDDAERPYFLGGNARRPAYQWRWTSNPDAVQEGQSKGLNQFAAFAGTPQVTHAARYANGAWELQLTRPLIPSDSAKSPVFSRARAIPIAFFASDGSNGEGEVRNAVSSWYSIYLDVPTPSRVYVAPALTVLLTAGLGLMVVRQAQRRGNGAD